MACRSGTGQAFMVSNSLKPRIDWVDYAKGICIILVVMMHSVLGVEKAAGEISWLNGFIDWARPFRMPDFFMISGLFLASRIGKPWREYLDSKVLHFAYFYVLWMNIQFVLKAPALYNDAGLAGTVNGYLMGYIEPYGTLWFIYMLALFFVVTKLLRNVNPLLVIAAASLLEIAPIHTGWMLIDEFAARFVYFYCGYWLAPRIFAFAEEIVSRSTAVVVSGLAIWAAFNGMIVSSGLSHAPGIGLLLGFIGAGAVVAAGVVLSKFRLAEALRYCGENSVVIYLAFFLFMAAARSLLLKLNVISDIGLVSLLVTAVGVIGPILLYWAVRKTPFAFLFRRPAAFRLKATAAKLSPSPVGTAFRSR
jgi:uncharacterized membrane protein YcfT